MKPQRREKGFRGDRRHGHRETPPTPRVTPALASELLRRACAGDVLENEPMSRNTSWHIGGPADSVRRASRRSDPSPTDALPRRARARRSSSSAGGSIARARRWRARGSCVADAQPARRAASNARSSSRKRLPRSAALLNVLRRARTRRRLELLAEIRARSAGVVRDEPRARWGRAARRRARSRLLLQRKPPRASTQRRSPFSYDAGRITPGRSCAAPRSQRPPTFPPRSRRAFADIRRNASRRAAASAVAGLQVQEPAGQSQGVSIEEEGLNGERDEDAAQ